MARNITPREKDYSQWYLDVIKAAELADYAPVRGCMIIRPNGYAVWESIMSEMGSRLIWDTTAETFLRADTLMLKGITETDVHAGSCGSCLAGEVQVHTRMACGPALMPVTRRRPEGGRRPHRPSRCHRRRFWWPSGPVSRRPEAV